MSDRTETIKPVRIDLGDGDSLNLYRMSDYVTVVRFHGNNPNVQLSSAQVSTTALRAALDEVAPAGSHARTDEKVETDSEWWQNEAAAQRERAIKAEENATYWENTSRAQTDAVGRWQARTEKAERERDVLAERVRDFADSIRREQATNDRLRAEQSRPLAPDAITDEMVERGEEAYRKTGGYLSFRSVHLVLTAALTEPAQPETDEDRLHALWVEWDRTGVADRGDQTFTSWLVDHGVRVVTEERS